MKKNYYAYRCTVVFSGSVGATSEEEAIDKVVKESEKYPEQVSFKPEDIKVDEKTYITYIEFTDGKTESAIRKCPCHPELIKKLEDFKGFKRPTYDAYSNVFLRIKKELGHESKRFAFHSIRGNTSTNLERMNCPPHLASQIIGHAKNSTFTYDYYSEGAGLELLNDYVIKLPTL